jgi:hypothetical protein
MDQTQDAVFRTASTSSEFEDFDWIIADVVSGGRTIERIPRWIIRLAGHPSLDA